MHSFEQADAGLDKWKGM